MKGVTINKANKPQKGQDHIPASKVNVDPAFFMFGCLQDGDGKDLLSPTIAPFWFLDAYDSTLLKRCVNELFAYSCRYVGIVFEVCCAQAVFVDRFDICC